MLNRLINIITVILVTILIGVGVLAIINFTKLSQDRIIDLNFTQSNPPLHRFMVIVDGTDLSNVEKLKKGVTKACLDNSVAFEFWDFKGESKEDNILRQFNIAIESKVDGIIIQAFEDDRFDGILTEKIK